MDDICTTMEQEDFIGFMSFMNTVEPNHLFTLRMG